MVFIYISGFIKFFIPKKFHSRLKAIFYSGNKVFCPCCERSFRKFLTIFGRSNAMCPFCGSMERHRLIFLYLNSKTNIFTTKNRLLHIAPEDVFISKFSNIKKIEYYTGDLNSPKASIKMDFTEIPFKENAFDAILCCHVLEHISNDQKAMREMFRILKNGGWALLQHPIDLQRIKTYEDPRKVTPEQRKKAFFQADHVRIYGIDFINRVEKAGFKVKKEDYVKQINEGKVCEYGLKRDELIYLCYK